MIISDCISDIESQFNVIAVIDCDGYDPSSVDLYNNIKKLHKDSYQPDDRLVFSISQDFYRQDETCGLMLQSLQAILNNIDISNFFVCIVTTNLNITLEYQWVLKNVSSDSVPCHVYQCQGSYQRLSTINKISYTKYQKLQNYDLIDTLTSEQKKLLFESDSFCIVPWTSMMINPTSQVQPCCESTEILGSCSTQSLQQIWNNVTTKNLRKNMLLGVKPTSCQNCYYKEDLGKDSLRKSLNRRFMHQIGKINLTEQDGHLENFNLNYIDARFNNLCNLSCRMCDPGSSSSWYNPALAIGKIDKSFTALQVAGKHDFDIYNQILSHIDTIERIYFAGGEPLIIEQFYKLVEELDRCGHHHVELIYNINMTKSGLGNRSVFDLWKNFKKISVGASLDGEYERGEYLRTGQHWQDVLDFRSTMLEKRPDIDFYVSATINIINALHLPDFHRSWVDRGLISAEDFNIGLLKNPEYLRVDRAPPFFKESIKNKYQKHLEWLRPKDPLGRAVNGFESVINFLDNDLDFDAKDFWSNITPLDQYHGQNLAQTFPELINLPKI
jgi:hypothetical protein